MKLRKVIFWLHLTAGATAGVIILVMSLTGVLLAFERQIIAIAERESRTGKAIASGSARLRASLDALFATAREQAPHWRLITLRLPQRGAPHMTVMIEEADTLHPYPRSILTLDARSGAVVKWEPFASHNLGRTMRSWVRPVHTGEAGGLIGQLIAAFASAGGVVLVYTGLALAWRRFWQFIRHH
jgi:uncharacterized iron-regulated membrane protein